MPQVRPLIDAYIDANIILMIAFLAWCVARAIFKKTSLKHDYGLQLRLSEGFMLAAVISPLVALGLTRGIDALVPGQSLNVADIAISQFLNGRLSMDAVQFETILSLRQDVVIELAYLDGGLAQAVVALFIAGVAFYFGKAFIGAWSVRSVINNSYIWRRFGRLDLRLSDTIRVPFSTRGLWRRHIVLPSAILTEPASLKIALAHELPHMRRNDTEWELALVFLEPLFFWNPAFRIWRQNIALLRELSCDQMVIKRRQVNPHAYANCLLSMCKRSFLGRGSVSLVTPAVPFFQLGTGAHGRRNLQALRQRVLAISAPNPNLKTSKLLFWVPLVTASLVIGASASAIQRPADWSHDRLMLSTVVNLERLESLNTSLIRSW